MKDVVSGPLAISGIFTPIFSKPFTHSNHVFKTIDKTFVNVHSVDVKLEEGRRHWSTKTFLIGHRGCKDALDQFVGAQVESAHHVGWARKRPCIEHLKKKLKFESKDLTGQQMDQLFDGFTKLGWIS